MADRKVVSVVFTPGVVREPFPFLIPLNSYPSFLRYSHPSTYLILLQADRNITNDHLGAVYQWVMYYENQRNLKRD